MAFATKSDSVLASRWVSVWVYLYSGIVTVVRPVLYCSGTAAGVSIFYSGGTTGSI